MNREQRRKAARNKAKGETYADTLAKQAIGRETLRLAMEDKAVELAADIICQRQLWAAVIALNEKWQFGPKRTRDFLETMEAIVAEFDEMKKKHGDAYAEEKLRERAHQVSGVEIFYQHEAERKAWEQFKAEQGTGERIATACGLAMTETECGGHGPGRPTDG